MTEINNKTKEAFHSTSNDQNTYHFLAEKVTVLVTGEQTNGEYAVAHIIEPPKMGPPLHIHEDDDESFFIVNGQFTFYVGDEVFEAKAGDYVFAPRGIPHRFVSGPEESEFIVTATPAGFDQFINELGTPVSKDASLPKAEPPSEEFMKRLVEVSKTFNITYPGLKI